MPFGLSTFRIITYVYLFLAILRFPAENSIIKILRRSYGDGLLKMWSSYGDARNKNSFQNSYSLK